MRSTVKTLRVPTKFGVFCSRSSHSHRVHSHTRNSVKAAEVCKNQCDLTNAMVFAATNDHFHVVMKLLHQLKLPNAII
ncbi:hypothetical protein GQ600_8247 [Phytophthora cactorum]|nr:hypothetical protein GQ600_8247 [Phytophthora cactorum]